jgi:lysophospholipase L1-like esterase
LTSLNNAGLSAKAVKYDYFYHCMLTEKKKRLLTIFITYILIELTCFIFIKSGLIRTKLPDFKYSFTLTEYPFEVADIDSVWGSWHYREHVHRKLSCLNLDYNINSWGARDNERTLHSPDTDRVVVLGDSFMEGYGMEQSERLSDQLQNKTNRAFINLSCQEFGTTQEFLVYKNLGLKFDHSTILIGVFPYNDFEDNDTSIHMNPYYKRFRPYFKGTFPDYHLIYIEDSIQKTNFNKQGFLRKENSARARLVRFLRSYTCWFNIVTYASDYLSGNNAIGSLGYFHYSGEQWNKMCFILKKILDLGKNKRIIIVTIPTSADIKEYRKSGIPSLHAAMDSFAKSNAIEYVDLLPSFASRPHSEQEFYFDCDRHWNQAGNKFAAEILLPLFRRR